MDGTKLQSSENSLLSFTIFHLFENIVIIVVEGKCIIANLGRIDYSLFLKTYK